jgi:hypothetical protein
MIMTTDIHLFRALDSGEDIGEDADDNNDGEGYVSLLV